MKTQCRKSSFEIEFKGLKAICLNGGGFNSDVFKSVYDESRHDIMMPFQFNGRFWTVSLYTTKDEVDCSVIAKSMGGGGHKKAAGFQVDDIKTIIR
jgi:nanoRNase/pAp phosphatase (c-di-AMP/oligoRNAs hydrolase)